MEREPVGSRHTACVVVRFFVHFKKKKKDQKSNFVISVEMADECVVAREPPHCRQSMVARLKLKGIDGRAPPGVEPAA